MKLEDAITRAKERSMQGRERRKHNFYNSPAFPDKLIRLFGTHFRECGYGEPPPTTQKIKGMLSGFIKVCRSNGWQEKRIYKTVELLVKNWPEVKRYEHHTLNNKKAQLGDRPSLLEFLICRETMLTAIHTSSQRKIESTSKETKSIKVSRGQRFTPTDEEMQAEYERMMEDQFGE
jgi:hypothetical protein